MTETISAATISWSEPPDSMLNPSTSNVSGAAGAGPVSAVPDAVGPALHAARIDRGRRHDTGRRYPGVGWLVIVTFLACAEKPPATGPGDPPGGSDYPLDDVLTFADLQ